MRKFLKTISMSFILIIAVLLVLSLMSFKGAGNMNNTGAHPDGRPLVDIKAPAKPGNTASSTTQTTSAGQNTAEAAYIFINANGTGDYKTLEEAVAGASKGTTIIMDSGTYVLTDALEMTDQNITLIGKGPGKTIITGEKGESIIYVDGDGKFFAEGIAFIRKGDEWGDVFAVGGGEASFNNCIFSGGKPNPDEDNWGSGIYYLNDSKGTISNCISESNAFVGIGVSDDSIVNIINNISRKNAYSGISYYGNIGGYAINNECYLNGSDGIQVQYYSVPSLINNKCHDNKYDGIAYYDNSGGLAFQNECKKNQWGIYTTDNASPVLEANILSGNTKKDLLQE
jgi:parallel beta-helix repeat protein